MAACVMKDEFSVDVLIGRVRQRTVTSRLPRDRAVGDLSPDRPAAQRSGVRSPIILALDRAPRESAETGGTLIHNFLLGRGEI